MSWEAALMGGLSALGGFGGAQMTNAVTEHLQHDQQNFLKYMSNTAHQREVADLRAAGLNPILSAGGGGASTPGAGMGSGTPMSDIIPKALSTAMDVKAQGKEFEAKDATIGNTKADTENKKVQADLLRNQNNATAQDIKTKAMQNTILQKTMDSAIKKAKVEGDYSEVREILSLINSGASSASQLINPFKGLLKQQSKP